MGIFRIDEAVATDEPMHKKFVVRLTSEERSALEKLVSTGKAAAHKIKHANILLHVDADGPNGSDELAAKVYRCHANTVRNVRQRFVEAGLEAALERKKQDRPSRTPVFDGAKEARLIATACSTPPAGRAKWTLELLADRLVELAVVESVSAETVRKTLKKTSCSPIAANAG